MQRPQRLWDQYQGKAIAESLRGCGCWPLQVEPCGLEPPWDAYERSRVNMWDCLVNDWDGGWSGGWLQRFLSFNSRVFDRTRPLELPEAEYAFDLDDLRSITIEQFPDDSSTIPKAEQLLRSLPYLTRPVAFEILGVGPQAKYDFAAVTKLLDNGQSDRLPEAITHWTVPYTVARFVAHQRDVPQLNRLLLAHYPNSAVVVGENPCGPDDQLPASNIGRDQSLAASLALEGAYCSPLKAYGKLDPDPLGVAIAAMDDLDRSEWALLQVLFERAERPWEMTLRNALANPYHDDFLLADVTPRELAEKFCGPLFAVSVNIAASRNDVFRQLLGWAEQFTSENQRLLCNDSEWTDEGMPDREQRSLSFALRDRTAYRPGMLLSAVELSSLVHLPSQAVVSPRLKAIKRRTQAVEETPEQVGSVLLGENVHRGKKRLARIPAHLRERHAYVAGASGTGKSTLLLNMILQDIQAGHGVGVLDPHGDLITDLLQRIPDERIDDVILFDPADEQFPIALNILEASGESEQERIVAETLMALERYFPSSWGPRLERILSFTLYTVLDALPGATLADVERMLIDAPFREQVVQRTSNPRYVAFWDNEFAWMPKNAADPVLNKLSVFLLNPTVRNIICQRQSEVDFDQVLNRGQIFLANLSTGMLSEKIAGTLGSFLVTKIVNAAFRRARLPLEQRRPWYLYVDEFQSFMNLSVGFERILAEARKYRLILAGLANQYVGQLSPAVRQAIFGNIGTMIVFRLGVDDASTIAREMGIFTAEEILSLELGEAIARAGGSQKSFNLTTYPEPPPRANDPTERIIEATRTRYARPRAEVEELFRLPRERLAEPNPSPAPPIDPTSATSPQPTPPPSATEETRRQVPPQKRRPQKRRSRNRRGQSTPHKPTDPKPEPRDPSEDDFVT